MSDELCFSVVSLSLYCYKEIIVKKTHLLFLFSLISGRCFLPKLTGPCKAYFPKYYFNHKTGKCEKFIYGGCMGNTNSFKTVTDCNDTCACKCPPVSLFFAYILVDNRLQICTIAFKFYFLSCFAVFCRQSIAGPILLPTKERRTLQGAHASIFLRQNFSEM